MTTQKCIICTKPIKMMCQRNTKACCGLHEEMYERRQTLSGRDSHAKRVVMV